MEISSRYWELIMVQVQEANAGNLEKSSIQLWYMYVEYIH